MPIGIKPRSVFNEHSSGLPAQDAWALQTHDAVLWRILEIAIDYAVGSYDADLGNGQAKSVDCACTLEYQIVLERVRSNLNIKWGPMINIIFRFYEFRSACKCD